MPEAQVSDGMLNKYFCVKYLCCHVINNRSRNFQGSNCEKECQLNRAEQREVKDSSYKLSKPSSSLSSGSYSDAAQGQILSNNHYTERGALTREGFSILV